MLTDCDCCEQTVKPVDMKFRNVPLHLGLKINMTLWEQVKQWFVLGPEIADEELFHKAYSANEMVFCLRVTFAEWTEGTILKISPVNFIRGLEFQILAKLRELSQETGEPRFQTLLSKLASYRKQLSAMTGSEMDSFYANFLKCFREEAKFLQTQQICSPEEICSIAPRVEDFAHVNGGASSFENEIRTKHHESRVRLFDIRARLLQERDHLQELLSVNSGLRGRDGPASISKFQDWHAQYWGSIRGEVPAHEVLGMDNPLLPAFYDTSQIPSLIADLFCVEGCKIQTLKDEIKNKLSDIISASKGWLHALGEFTYCLQRRQQAAGNGIEVPSVSIADLVNDQRMFVEQILTFLSEMKSLVDAIIEAFHDVNRINVQTPQLLCSQLFASSQETHFVECRKEFHKILLSIRQKFLLIVPQQPEQVIKTERKTHMSVKLLNFGSSQSGIPLKVYLINEPMARRIKGEVNGVLEKIDSAGTLALSVENTGRKGLKRGASPALRRHPYRFRKENEETRRVEAGASHLAGPSNESTTPILSGKVLRTEPMELSPDHLSLNMQLPVTVKVVERRKTGRAPTEAYENVTREKFCFLFVAELVIENEPVKTWAISLPMIVTTHGSHNEGAWATIAWDNAFPVYRRVGFEVQPNAKWLQICEMLKAVFNHWVGVPLKPSHVEYIKLKLKAQLGSQFPNAISWNSLCHTKMKTSGFPFWSWFYKAAMIAKGHFKDAWSNGYIEGFIGYDEASDVLLRSKAKPGTFIVRFSDSEAGSLSIVFIGGDGRPYRMQPIGVYRKKSVEDCCAALLEKLNVRQQRQGRDVFRWVYPNISKRVAFKKFYDLPAPSKLTNAKNCPNYLFVIGVLPLSPSSESNSSSQESNESSEDNEFDVGQSGISTVVPTSVEELNMEDGGVESKPSTSHKLARKLDVKDEMQSQQHVVADKTGVGLMELINDLIKYEEHDF